MRNVWDLVEVVEFCKGGKTPISNLGRVGFEHCKGLFGKSFALVDASTDKCIGGGVGMMKTCGGRA